MKRTMSTLRATFALVLWGEIRICLPGLAVRGWRQGSPRVLSPVPHRRAMWLGHNLAAMSSHLRMRTGGKHLPMKSVLEILLGETSRIPCSSTPPKSFLTN